MLNDLRIEKGLSMRKLADIADVNLRTIYLIEHGKVNPTALTRRKLEKALDIERGTLIISPKVSSEETEKQAA